MLRIYMKLEYKSYPGVRDKELISELNCKLQCTIVLSFAIPVKFVPAIRANKERFARAVQFCNIISKLHASFVAIISKFV